MGRAWRFPWFMLKPGFARPISEATYRAYRAPYPKPAYEQGLAKFPALIAVSPRNPGVPLNRAAWEKLRTFDKPFLTLFGAKDPVARGADRRMQRHIPGAAGQPHQVMPTANHFVQEDEPQWLVEHITRFLEVNKMTNPPLTLFGAPVGLYTGKIRSYLRKQGIPYVERLPTDPVFQSEVMPAVRRFINPVIRMHDGTLVQDTADIIDYLERNGHAAFSVYPALPLQRLVALTLDLFGGEGLVRAAMHYRWSYREYNEPFLRHEFGLAFRAIGLPDSVITTQLDRFMSHLKRIHRQARHQPDEHPHYRSGLRRLAGLPGRALARAPLPAGRAPHRGGLRLHRQPVRPSGP